MKVLFAICLCFSAISSDLKIKARSTTPHCTYVYRVETDFQFFVDSEDRPEVSYFFVSKYTGEPSPEQNIEFDRTEDGFRSDFTEITFNTVTKTLFHDMYFSFEGESYHFNFLHLRSKCFPGGRSQTPFQTIDYTKLP